MSCNCPPLETYLPVIRNCFRWVHEDPNHVNNFSPVIFINQSRTPKDCAERCAYYALSFFQTLAKAEEKYRSLAGKVATFPDKVGNSIAEGTIYERDGVAGPISKSSGHFDFHEYEDTNLKGRFTIVKKIKL